MPIQISLPNGEIGEFPDGTPDAEIERVLASQFSAPGQKPQAQPLSWGDVPGQALSNTLPSMGRFAGDMWGAVTSPIQTAKALGNTALGYGQMAVGSQGEERKLAEGMNAYFADRYGSAEGFKRALATDPVGVLADASTALTGVGGAIKGGVTGAIKAGATGRAVNAAGSVGRAMSTAGALTDPISMAGKATYPIRAAAGGMGNLITGGQPLAEKLYSAAIKPGTSLTPAERASAIQTGIAEKILPNQAGYDKLRALIESTAKSADDKVAYRNRLESVGAAPTNIDPNVVAQGALGDALNIYGNTVSPTAGKAAIDAAIGDFLDTYGSRNISTADAQKMKKATYQAIESAYNGEMSSPGVTAQKAIVRELKDAIAQNAPDVQTLNDKMHNLYGLSPELERALARTQNHNFLGLGAMLGGAGAIGSGAGLLGAPLLIAGGAKVASEPVNVARAAFAADALARARSRVGGLLDRIPDALNRRNVMLPAYVDRMRQDGAE